MKDSPPDSVDGLAADAGPGVDDPQAQAAAGSAPGQRVGVDQGVATLGHHLQPLVGQARDLLQPRRQHVGRQPHPQGVVAAGAADAVGQLLHDGLLGLGRPDARHDGEDLVAQLVDAPVRRLGEGLGAPGLAWRRRGQRRRPRPAPRGRARAAARRQRRRAGPAAPRPGRAGCRAARSWADMRLSSAAGSRAARAAAASVNPASPSAASSRACVVAADRRAVASAAAASARARNARVAAR